MKLVKRAFTPVNFAGLLGAWTARFHKRPSLDRYGGRWLPDAEKRPGEVRVTFFGVSTLLFEDNEKAFIIDGFFTRPGRLRTFFTKLSPDCNLIKRYLKQAGVTKLEAVIVLHSHHDHALDAPEVALQTSADLVGSDSTANIGRGYGVPKDRIKTWKEKTFGRFHVTLIPTPHCPMSLLTHFNIRRVALEGHITKPLRQPAPFTEYKVGDSYSVLITHDGTQGRKTMLVQGSGGFDPGALKSHRADVVFLGVGTLGGIKEKDYLEHYWHEVVETVRARRVIPIHWDDFFVPLNRPFKPMPRPIDDFDKTTEFLLERHKDFDVKMLPARRRVDPFAGLAETR